MFITLKNEVLRLKKIVAFRILHPVAERGTAPLRYFPPSELRLFSVIMNY